jgi:hypothetical protein
MAGKYDQKKGAVRNILRENHSFNDKWLTPETRCIEHLNRSIKTHYLSEDNDYGGV